MSALIVRDGPKAGERLDVEAEVVLGRESQEAFHHDGEISRRHAAVRPGPEGLEIEDLGSSNGTFVNDERVTAATPIRPGDVVRVGQTTLEVEATPATAGTVIRDVPEPAPPPAQEASVPPVVPAADATAPLDAGPGPVPAGPPTGPPPLGPPPAGPPAYDAPPVGPPLAGPPPYGPPGMAGRKPAILTTGGIVLIVVGALSAAFGAWRLIDLLGLRSDVAVFESIFGPTDLESQLLILIVLSIVGVIGSILTIIGGARLLARSRAGVTLGIIGVAILIVAWGAYLAYVLIQGFRVDAMVWVGIIGTLLGAGAGLGLLLGGRKHVAPPMSASWAA